MFGSRKRDEARLSCLLHLSLVEVNDKSHYHHLFSEPFISKKEHHLPLHHGQNNTISNLPIPTFQNKKKYSGDASLCFFHLTTPSSKAIQDLLLPTDLVQYQPPPFTPVVFSGLPTFSTSARANAFSASESSSCKPRCAAEAWWEKGHPLVASRRNGKQWIEDMIVFWYVRNMNI